MILNRPGLLKITYKLGLTWIEWTRLKFTSTRECESFKNKFDSFQKKTDFMQVLLFSFFYYLKEVSKEVGYSFNNFFKSLHTDIYIIDLNNNYEYIQFIIFLILLFIFSIILIIIYSKNINFFHEYLNLFRKRSKTTEKNVLNEKEINEKVNILAKKHMVAI